jgi:hypothetical protein
MSTDLILISGVNGYIAANAAKHLLDHGHSVRGTVRNAASAKDLLDGPLKSYAVAGKFTIVEVPDITVDGAFDEAVKGGEHTCRLLDRMLLLTLPNRRNSHSSSRIPCLLLFLGPVSCLARRHHRDANNFRKRPRPRRATAQVHRRYVVHCRHSVFANPAIYLYGERLE